ncbi:MAG: aminotransferase class V-fold PLP-dependent enzyme [Bacilli bacterium]|nr:aminotransferase class V-fold PLP-dependent enzyme [Bacilli bacterium]
MIYFDATSNVKSKQEVLDEFLKIENVVFANANSLHQAGKDANQIINEYQDKIYEVLKLDKNKYDIIHTSSGTESNNLAIKGFVYSHSGFGKHILVSPLEHSSTNATLGYLKDNNYEIEFIAVNKDGKIDLTSLDKQIRKDTILIIINLVDGEAGFIQDYKEILKIADNHQVKVFFDVVQAFGKFPLDYSSLGFFSLSPHKFGGLLGTGLLIKKKEIVLTPLIHGGKSLTLFRSGSIPTSLIAATSKAIEIALENQEEHFLYLKKLHDYLIKKLININEITINSPLENPYITNISIRGFKGSEVVEYLSNNNIYVSQKAACNITNTPSKVLMAVYNDKARAISSIRISMNEDNTLEEIDEFLNKLMEMIYGR